MGKRYYDLDATLELAHRLKQTGLVDGIEVQLLAEWYRACPPRDEGQKRLSAWRASEKYSTDGLTQRLRQSELPVASVHANRDVGILLCSKNEADRSKGKALVRSAMQLAQGLDAPVCVFHLWDTWSKEFVHETVIGELNGIAIEYPDIRASVENVPTHLPNRTPADLLQGVDWITLDLRWAAMYDELRRFADLRDRIANVHLRGRLDGERWLLENAPFGFYEAMDTIVRDWHYQGPLTVEPSELNASDWEHLVAALGSIRDLL